MTINEKKEYLERYREAHEHYIKLNEKLNDVKGLDYTQIKGNNHRSLNKRIQERDEAFDNMMEIMNEIHCLLRDYDVVLSFKYLSLMSYEEIANILNYSVTQIKRRHKKALEVLVIPLE